MQLVTTVAELQTILSAQRKQGKRIGLVPTMGALHSGHISLVSHARKSADFIAMTIFVNPLQFNNAHDLEKYPRTLETDAVMAKEGRVDLLFAPSLSEIYPSSEHETVKVRAGSCGQALEGLFRPGHFDGVVTVVSILFNLFRPDIAVFGEKDFQQVKVIEQMVEDLHYQLTVIAAPTMRDPDGLAMSSRNTRLNAAQRSRALSIPRVLFAARSAAKPNAILETVLGDARAELEKSDLKIEYVEAVDPKTLTPVKDFSKPSQLLIAAWCDDIRLIDNVRVHA